MGREYPWKGYRLLHPRSLRWSRLGTYGWRLYLRFRSELALGVLGDDHICRCLWCHLVFHHTGDIYVREFYITYLLS